MSSTSILLWKKAAMAQLDTMFWQKWLGLMSPKLNVVSGGGKNYFTLFGDSLITVSNTPIIPLKPIRLS